MNLFTYRKMEEDHYTNILMSIISSKEFSLLPKFLQRLLGSKSNGFSYQNKGIELFSKVPPQVSAEYEYIIGIAPYENQLSDNNDLENNMDSIPDAWIYGENFTLLFEFKIRGSLDEAQLAAHKMKLLNCKDVIRLKWPEVITALEFTKREADQVQLYLIDEFIKSSKRFKSKRKSSGMPKEIVGGKNKEDDLHFVITGSKDTNGYTVDMVFPNGIKKRLNDQLTGIQSSRRWIANFIYDQQDNLPIESIDEESVITDRCVKPGRPKDSWNQWRLGSYLE